MQGKDRKVSNMHQKGSQFLGILHFFLSFLSSFETPNMDQNNQSKTYTYIVLEPSCTPFFGKLPPTLLISVKAFLATAVLVGNKLLKLKGSVLVTKRIYFLKNLRFASSYRDHHASPYCSLSSWVPPKVRKKQDNMNENIQNAMQVQKNTKPLSTYPLLPSISTEVKLQ